MGDMGKRIASQRIARPWAGDGILRPGLQEGDAEGVEGKKDKPPPIRALPDHYPYP